MDTIKVIGSPLYQWEIGRKIAITPPPKTEVDGVEFAHKGDTDALLVKLLDENGVLVADIPNILLQSGEPIFVYLVYTPEGGIETTTFRVLPVIQRPKPSGYVYTETEVLNYQYLDKRLQDLEGEGLANAVAAYLEENPVEAGATAEEAAQITQNKEDIEKLNTDKLDANKLPEAVNDALAQAKASGEFDGPQGPQGEQGEQGEPGADGADGYTPVKGVDYFDGQDGKDGEPGADGKDYVLTDADKQEIAEQAAGMVEVPETEIPFFDLAEMGLGVVSLGNDKTATVTTDTTEILEAVKQGAIKVGFNVDFGDDSIFYVTAVVSGWHSEAAGAAQCTFWIYAEKSISMDINIASDSILMCAPAIVPETLPNPNALTFTGAVSATYDGSSAVSIEIPSGGSGGSGGGASGWTHIDTIDLSSGALSYEFDTTGYNEIMLVNITALNYSGGTMQWKGGYRGVNGANIGLQKQIGTLFTFYYLGNGTIAYSNGRQSDTLFSGMAAIESVDENNNTLRITFTSVTSGTIFIAGRA